MQNKLMPNCSSDNDQSTRLAIGPVRLANPVFLAPMTGVSDLPFRRLARRLGAGAVVSEMVASSELVKARPQVLRKTDGRELSPHVIQLVGCDARWMGEAARLSQDLGAAVVDINMGCPSREVTGRASGSALMRDLDHAIGLIDAVVKSVSIPVTLKMRLGWDDASRNAPELAKRAEASGVRMVTVHGRTRQQFFKGTADWSFVRRVREAIALPILVNGDIRTPDDARRALQASGADGVMVGRGAYGAPWAPGRIANALQRGIDPGAPALHTQAAIAQQHIEDMLSYYGTALGLKSARKHIGWYIESAGVSGDEAKAWRRRLCTDEDANIVLAGLAEFYASELRQAA